MTNTKQPTKAQIQEFWVRLLGKQFILDNDLAEDLPIDLNNLFKYAVPKLYKDGQGGIEFRYYPGRLECVLTTECEAGFDETKTFNKEFDPALALFWAIWEVIHND